MAHILQKDPFGDGWWVLVDIDGEQLLTHVYDERGREAPYPGDAAFIAAAQAQLDARVPVVTLTVTAEDGTVV